MAQASGPSMAASGRHAGLTMSAGAFIICLNLFGLGAAEPAPSPAAPTERPVSISRGLVDRAAVQPSIHVPDRKDPLFEPAQAYAEPAPPLPGEEICVVLPLEPGTFRISSTYGIRSHPLTGRTGLHAGVDLAAAMGTTIFAVADGVIAYVGPGKAGRSSTLVIIDHDLDGEVFSSWYVHMYPKDVFVEAGQEVSAGEPIARVGSNGNSTGPHLHLEIHSPVDLGPGRGMAAGARHPLNPGELPEVEESRDDAEAPDDPGTPDDPGSPGDVANQLPASAEEAGAERDTGEDTGEQDPDEQDPGEQDPGEQGADDPGDGAAAEDPSGPPQEEDPGSKVLPGPEEATDESEPRELAEIEVTDDGLNDHVINDTVDRVSGVFDPASLGLLHDPLPFLEQLGYGLLAPSGCFTPGGR